MRAEPPEPTRRVRSTAARPDSTVPERPAERGWIVRHLPLIVAAGLTLLALAPLLAPGFVLTYDMVFVPKVRWSLSLLGLGTAVPRAVPNDLLAGLLSSALSAQIAQKLILAGSLMGGAVGASQLVSPAHPAAKAAAGALYVWNASTYERLVMGHWPLLVSLAALPWAVRAALDLRDHRPRSLRRLVGALAVASFGSPSGGAIATGVCLMVGAAPPWTPRGTPRGRAIGKRASVVLFCGLILNLPWLVPSLLRSGGLPVRPAGLDAFAAGSDSPLGTAGSLLTLGGIWNGNVIPPGRLSWAWVPAFVLIQVVIVAGWRRGTAWRTGAIGLAAAAGLGFLLAVAPSVPLLRDGFRLVALHIPGGGLLRDSQKFIAPLILLEAIGFGHGVNLILATRLGRGMKRATAIMMVLAPVALLPALAWGAAGRLGTTMFPSDWSEVRQAMAEDAQPGAVLVLPWHLYVAFPWNADRPVLQPAQRFFTRQAVVNDDLELASGSISGEDPWAARATPLVRSTEVLGDQLASLGIRYVLIEKIADWKSYLPRLAELEPVRDGRTLSLYRAPPPHRVIFASPPVVPVLIGDVMAAMLALWALGGLLVGAGKGLLSFSGRRRKGNE
jgi:hypothetical protein